MRWPELKRRWAHQVLAVDMDVGDDASVTAPSYDDADGGPVEGGQQRIGGDGAAIDMPPADFDATIATNLRAACG